MDSLLIGKDSKHGKVMSIVKDGKQSKEFRNVYEVGDGIILSSRGRSLLLVLTSSNIVIRYFSCKQTRHMFPYDA